MDKIAILRDSAQRSRDEAERQHQTSEYPRYGRAVHREVANATDILAAWLEEHGTEPPEGKNRYETRRLARVYWLRRKALEKDVEATHLSAQSHDMGSHRPLGQPIVGSPARQRTQRNAIERERRKDQKAYETHQEATELNRRANAAEANHAISSQDPEAIAKLRAKLQKLEADRETIKARRPKPPPILNYRQPEGFEIPNRYNPRIDHLDQIEMTKAEWKRVYADYKSTRIVGGLHRVRIAMRNHALVVVFLTDSKEHPKPTPAPMDERTTGTDAVRERAPQWMLTNIGKEIQRVKDRITELEAREAYEPREERMIGPIRVIDNTEFHKVELHFPEKPDSDTRRFLKSHGFRWIRTEGCWSRTIGGATEYALRELAQRVSEVTPPPPGEEPRDEP